MFVLDNLTIMGGKSVCLSVCQPSLAPSLLHETVRAGGAADSLWRPAAVKLVVTAAGFATQALQIKTI